MKHNHIFHLLAVVLLSACQANDEAIVPDAALEIRGITAAIDGDNVAATRATDETTVTVGRAAFAANDKIVFTEIRRTNSPLKEFTYKKSVICTMERAGRVPRWSLVKRRFTGPMAHRLTPLWAIVSHRPTIRSIMVMVPTQASWVEILQLLSTLVLVTMS